MDLAVVQGAGSRLTLTPKIYTVDDHQQLQNLINVRVPDNTTAKELRIVDEVLMRRQQPESFIQQGIRDIEYQTVDGVDEISTAEINVQPPKVELKADASNLSVDIADICINTSTSSTDGSQILAQQEWATVDAISPPASTVEDSSTGSTSEPETVPTAPTAQPIAPPEPEIAPTAQPSQPKSKAQLVAELVNQIAAKLRKAIAENDAGAVREITSNTKKRDRTGGLYLAVKACLTDTEKEACRSLTNANWKQSQQQPVESSAQISDSITSSEPEVAEPIALPDNSQEPESVPVPATEPREPESVESPAQPTDTSSAPEAQPEVEADPEVVEDVE